MKKALWNQLPSFVDEDMVSLTIDSDVNHDLSSGYYKNYRAFSRVSAAVARLVQSRTV